MTPKFDIDFTAAFKQDLKTIKKRRYKPELLVYRIDTGNSVIILARTGTHSDLFNK